MSPRDIAVLRPDQPIPARGRFLLAVPGHLAPVQHFDLPDNVKGAARLGIARQLLADRLGPSADPLTILPWGDKAWAHAIVCDPDQVEEYCKNEVAQHKRCLGVVPDMLALPFAPDTLVIDCDDAAVRVRLGQYLGFSAPPDVAPVLLRRLLAEQTPLAVHFVTAPPTTITAITDEAGLQEKTSLPTAPQPSCPDLRQTLASGSGRDVWLWGAAAVLTAVAFVLWTAAMTLETRSLQSQTADIRAQTVAVLRQGMIPQGPVLDIRQQVAQVLANRTGAAGDRPVDLLSRVSVGLFGTGVRVGAIRLDTTANGLEVTITADSFADVDALVAQLVDSGLLVSARDMRNQPDQGVTARLIVAGGEDT